MINEKRVRHMARMEIERRKNKEYYDLLDFSGRKDFLSYNAVLALVEGTVFYAAVFFGAVCVIYSVFNVNLTSLVISLTVFLAVIGYLVFLIFYMRGTYKNAEARYDKGMQFLRHADEQWDELALLYKEEEEQLAPRLDVILEDKDDAVY